MFYALYTKRFQRNNETAWGELRTSLFPQSREVNRSLADVDKQLSLMYENTVQLPDDANYTGLLYHGYDASFSTVWASPDRGHSPEIWDRALGARKSLCTSFFSIKLDSDLLCN